MTSGRAGRLLWWLLLAAACAAWGCAARGGVPIESRPTPPQPEPGAAVVDSIVPVEPAGGREREATRSRAAADTLKARAAMDRCAGRKLMPDQEATYDATAELLARARAAFASDDLARALSLAREARQLAASLNCP